ncbi:MAG: hypothetical protein M3066_15830 [Actinomycetota bacterium]|nr:hypothetical protein [Actinomycetota bacterium]
MTLPKLALGIVVAVALGACSGERAIISSSGATTTAVATTEATTTIVPPTSEATPGTSSTTRPAAPASTVPRPTTTRPPASTTTTTAVPPPCSGAQLSVDVVTDKATYRPGELVSALATLRNRSGAPCVANGYSGSSRFSGPAGQPVGDTGMLIGEGGPFGLTTIGAGGTMTQKATFDQRICAGGAYSCTQAPPGVYTITVDWTFTGPPIVGSKAFMLVAA